MLVFLDILFTIIHLGVIFFNLLGWIWKRTRKLHMAMILLTLASWFLLGIKYGFGYCFLTDWHWNVKRQLGEYNLPNSFVQYVFEELGLSIVPATTDFMTLIAFMIAIGMGLYLNFFKK